MKKFFLMLVLAFSMSSCNYFSSESQSQDSNVVERTAVQEVVDTLAVDSVVVVDSIAE